MDITYQVVLFNIDRPAEPSQAKDMYVNKSQYQSIKSGWIKDFKLGDCFYEVQGWRAFDITSELFGTRHMLVIDVKKK